MIITFSAMPIFVGFVRVLIISLSMHLIQFQGWVGPGTKRQTWIRSWIRQGTYQMDPNPWRVVLFQLEALIILFLFHFFLKRYIRQYTKVLASPKECWKYVLKPGQPIGWMSCAQLSTQSSILGGFFSVCAVSSPTSTIR